MKRHHLFLIAAMIILLFTVDNATAESDENHFASILLNGKKIGQVHFTIIHDNKGRLQEVKTRASLSILGVQVYHHSLHTHEFWEAEELKHLWGNANEDGTTYELDLTRKPDDYVGTRNTELITLPAQAFPTAVWHYAITEHSQLFSIPQLNLLNVKVNKSLDTVRIGDKNIAAEKFVFSGDWETTIWFDYNKKFLKWEYIVKGKKVIVLLDSK